MTGACTPLPRAGWSLSGAGLPLQGRVGPPRHSAARMPLRTCSPDRCPLRQKVGLASSSTFQITRPLCSMPVSSQGTCARCAENSFFPDGACQAQSGEGCEGNDLPLGVPISSPCKAFSLHCPPPPGGHPDSDSRQSPGSPQEEAVRIVQAITTLNLSPQPLTHCPRPVMCVLAACRSARG